MVVRFLLYLNENYLELRSVSFFIIFPQSTTLQKFYRSQNILDLSSKIQLSIAIQLSGTIYAYKSLGELYLELGNRVIRVHRW